jgi:DNA mismatch endonuclease (patch repair protein)
MPAASSRAIRAVADNLNEGDTSPLLLSSGIPPLDASHARSFLVYSRCNEKLSRNCLMRVPTQPDTSARMRRVRSINTTPEILFRKALWPRGLRYAICKTELPGKPDIVLASRKIAIFIDGDLWHGGQWQRRGKVALEDQFGAARSKDCWLGKIRRNMDRDCSATNKLLCAGWTVLRFWESEIHKDIERCVETTMKVIDKDVKATPLSLLPQKSFADTSPQKSFADTSPCTMRPETSW